MMEFDLNNQFHKLVQERRSVRKFTSEAIPDQVVDACLDLGLLAPNSSNLQTWEFYRVKSPVVKKKVAEACFNQSAAVTASELIVCVARADLWKKHNQQMLKIIDQLPNKAPNIVTTYYKKIVPFFYTTGYFDILVPFKWIFLNLVGLFRMAPRGPFGSLGVAIVSIKSCALACQNIMLGFKSFDFDTCAMEGFDSSRVKKVLNLPRSAFVVMIIAAGKKAPGGVFGPRLRFPREQFIKNID